MGSPREFRARRAPAEHPLAWLIEPLESDPTFVNKAWFGGRSLMLRGMHRLVLTTQGEPWQGVLVCTSREYHVSLRAELPSLIPHPILGKWLYLSEQCETFERDARKLIRLARACDPRLGVAPQTKKRTPRKIRFGEEP